MIDQLCDILIKKYAFIYKIKDKYFCIGDSVFAQCNSEQIDMYNDYCKEFNSLRELNPPYGKNETEKLAKATNEIISALTCVHDQSKNIEVWENLNNELKKCSEEDLRNLETQIDDFIEAYNYSNKHFYNS